MLELLLLLLLMMVLRLLMGQRGQCLHVLDILVQHHRVVRVLFTRHVYPQIARDVCFVIAYVTAKRELRFALIATLGGPVWTMILLMVGTPRRHWRVLRRGGIASTGATPASLLQFLHVIQMLVTLHMYAEIAFRRGGIIAHFTPVWLVATGIGFATC